MTYLRASAYKIYQIFHLTLVKYCILPLFYSKNRPRSFLKDIDSSTKFKNFSQINALTRVWFHASSVGELEALTPLILSFAESRLEIIVTILSESAWNPLQKLKQSLEKKESHLLFIGFSPWEGEWKNAFEFYQPQLFVTTKYEAWPDLWATLYQKKIPLAILSAQLRRSLRVAKFLCQLFVSHLPKILFFTVSKKDEDFLKKVFPHSSFYCVGEPRWDRVFQRLDQLDSNRIHIWLERLGIKKDEIISHSQPWFIIGSAWLEDLKFLFPLLKKLKTIFWIVPHKIDEKTVLEIESFLKAQGFQPKRTFFNLDQKELSHNRFHGETSCWIVNEMGFLAELYSVGDFAYVGGGFGAGVHSTIEPAIQGIPLGIGPKSHLKFPEISFLKSEGQLTLLETQKDLSHWIQSLQDLNQSNHEKKIKWKNNAFGQKGATQKIRRILENFKSSC